MKQILLLLLICLPYFAFSQDESNPKKPKDTKIKPKEEIKQLKASLAKLNNDYNSLKEKNKSSSPLAQNPSNNTTSDSIKYLKKEIESLQKMLSDNDKPNSQLKIENNQLKDSIKSINDSLALKIEENRNYKATLLKIKEEISGKDTEILKIRKENDRIQSLNSENIGIVALIEKKISSEISTLLVALDMQAQKLKISSLKLEIEDLKKTYPKFPSSIDRYVNELKWYQEMSDAIDYSKKILDETYEIIKVTSAVIKLESIQNSVIAKPTSEQNKIIETQKTLLKDYCGRYNYVVNKMIDADFFKADKVSALEEIEAALKRTDKNYTFLIKKLEERKKNPTNKVLTLEKVDCPKE